MHLQAFLHLRDPQSNTHVMIHANSACAFDKLNVNHPVDVLNIW